MKKEDFKKGQTVYVLLVGNMARRSESKEERIQEWEVVSVGRKYITARPKGSGGWRETKFEIERDFRQVYTYGTADYELYLSKEDIYRSLRKDELIREIERMSRWGGNLGKLSNERLEEIYKIMKETDQ